MTKVNITVTIPMEINIEELDGVTIEDVSRLFNLYLDESQDYRPCFSIEMLTDSLARCVKDTIKLAIEKVHQKRFDREYVETKNKYGEVNGHMAKWCVTSLTVINKIKLIFTGFFTGKVERV